jgi:hypothetical protein
MPVIDCKYSRSFGLCDHGMNAVEFVAEDTGKMDKFFGISVDGKGRFIVDGFVATPLIIK